MKLKECKKFQNVDSVFINLSMNTNATRIPVIKILVSHLSRLATEQASKRQFLLSHIPRAKERSYISSQYDLAGCFLFFPQYLTTRNVCREEKKQQLVSWTLHLRGSPEILEATFTRSEKKNFETRKNTWVFWGFQSKSRTPLEIWKLETCPCVFLFIFFSTTDEEVEKHLVSPSTRSFSFIKFSRISRGTRLFPSLFPSLSLSLSLFLSSSLCLITPVSVEKLRFFVSRYETKRYYRGINFYRCTARV